MKKIPLIIIAGPTAVGKTELSIQLAQKISGQIISCDSMQVYKYMDIGSAKIMPDEMKGIPHYLVDVLEPDEEFHVAKFVSMAKDAIEEIQSTNHIPIAVGGTGFYIQALLYDAVFEAEEKDDAYRQELELLAKKYGKHALWEELQKVDAESAKSIHENNVKRVIRALEFYKLHHYPISLHNKEMHQKESPYEFCYFVLNDQREHLYHNIDLRVDRMISAGLFEEVKFLYDKGYRKNLVSMQGLGYKELLDVIDGNLDFDEAIYTIKRDTRHFAKRQLTWFKSKDEVIWIDKDVFDYDDNKILDFMLQTLQEKKIIN